MKLLRSTKKAVDKDKNGERVSKLQVFEVVLVHCNLVKMIISILQRYYLLLYQIKHSVN